MSHHPYPDAERALRQLGRHHHAPAVPLRGLAIDPDELQEFARVALDRLGETLQQVERAVRPAAAKAAALS